jgi:hypothetical protein
MKVMAAVHPITCHKRAMHVANIFELASFCSQRLLLDNPHLVEWKNAVWRIPHAPTFLLN